MDFTKYTNKIEYTEDTMIEYENEENRLYCLFRKDALAELGLEGHQKADEAFRLAWDKGHAYGYQEVYGELLDLAKLLN